MTLLYLVSASWIKLSFLLSGLVKYALLTFHADKQIPLQKINFILSLLASVASVTVVIGMIQMRELEFIPEGDIELDNILLLIAQTGVYIYTSFTVIGGHFTMTVRNILPYIIDDVSMFL